MLRDELIKKMKASHEAMRALEGDKLMAERAKFDELKDEVERIDTIAMRERMAVDIKETKDNELWGVFGKLMRGEYVGDNGRDALAIREASLRDSAGRDAFRLPGDGLAWMRRSTTTTTCDPLGSVSEDIEEAIPGAALAPMYMLPLPPTPFFDGSTKLHAINGVAAPFLIQTAEDPFASVEIGTEVCEGGDKPESGIPSVDDLLIYTSEYSGSTVISDLALRRAPNYEAIIGHIMRGALAYEVEQDIITELTTNVGVVDVARNTALAVDWDDLIDLEAAVPFYWAVNGKYALSQTAQAYLKGTLASTPIGYPLYTSTTANAMYNSLNGRPYFLDLLPALGTTGDVIYGDPANVFLSIGQDIVFRRTNEGLQLTRANSTLFAVFAHIGLGIPVPATFSRLDNVATTTTTTGL